MALRIVDFGTASALFSQAAWYGFARHMKEGDAPVLCLVESAEPYLCIGFSQNADRELDREFCAEKGLAVIRRRLGGGAVYIDERQLIFHFVFPRRTVPPGPLNLYPYFIAPVLSTYRDFGIAALTRPPSDIHVAGRKIGGTAAALWREAVVLGGSFLFDFDGALFARSLKVPSLQFREKLERALEEHMTSMRRLLREPPSRASVKARFSHHAARSFGLEAFADDPRPQEMAAIREEEARLSDRSSLDRPGRKLVPNGVKIAAGIYLTEGSSKAEGGLLHVRLLERDGKIADLDLSCDPEGAAARGLALLASRLKGNALDKPILLAAIAEAMSEIGIEPSTPSAEEIAAALAAARHRGP